MLYNNVSFLQLSALCLSEPQPRCFLLFHPSFRFPFLHRFVHLISPCFLFLSFFTYRTPVCYYFFWCERIIAIFTLLHNSHSFFPRLPHSVSYLSWLPASRSPIFLCCDYLVFVSIVYSLVFCPIRHSDINFDLPREIRLVDVPYTLSYLS